MNQSTRSVSEISEQQESILSSGNTWDIFCVHLSIRYSWKLVHPWPQTQVALFIVDRQFNSSVGFVSQHDGAYKHTVKKPSREM